MGDVFAAEVQRAAGASYKHQKELLERAQVGEEHASVMLRNLASLGNSGKQMQNSNKDLKRYLGEPNMPKEQSFNVPVRVLKRKRSLTGHLRYGVVTVPLACMRPHLMFHHLYTSSPEVFAESILGDGVRPREFWTVVGQRRDPRLQHHPMMEKERWLGRAIHLSIHGDGVAVVKVGGSGTRSLDCISWQSLLGGVRGVQTLKQLVFSIFEESKALPQADDGVDTMYHVWDNHFMVSRSAIRRPISR